MAEIARKYMREGIEEASEITSIDKEMAIESARCYMQLTEKAKNEKLKAPSLFDAIILATAKTLNAKVITGDEHFQNLKETLWIGAKT